MQAPGNDLVSFRNGYNSCGKRYTIAAHRYCSKAVLVQKIKTLVPVFACFLSTFLFGQPSADTSGISLLQQSYDRQQAATSFMCDITDNIARTAIPYFRRTLPDGVTEVATVLSMDPLRVGIQNRRGFWIVSEREAININFQSAQQPQRAALALKTENPNDVVIKAEGHTMVDGTDCLLVDANLSVRLARRLADAFREKHKSSTKLKENPSMDMLQFIAMRRLFWIGADQPLLYKYREYDGNGDLLRDISFSNHRLNESIPDDVFMISTNLKVFTAFTPKDLQKHIAATAAQSRNDRLAAWRNLFSKSGESEVSDSQSQTNSTNK